MNYCIAQFEKVKDFNKVGQIAGHNFRTHLSQADQKRIDTNYTKYNEVAFNSLGVDTTNTSSLSEKIKDFFDKEKIEIKKDNVLAIDLVLSASPEYWGEWKKNGKITPEGQKKIDEFKAVQVNFMKEQFGSNFKLMVMHYDESTPHGHALVTTEEAKVVKYKNRFGESEKNKVVLNAKRWNPSFWKFTFLNNFAKHNKKLNLVRGKMDSKAEKITIKEYHNEIEKAINTDYSKAIGKMLSKVEEDLSFVNTKAMVMSAFESVFKPEFEKLLNSNKTFKSLKGGVKKEYANYIKIKEKLEKELKETLELKDHYQDGLSIRMRLEKELEELTPYRKAFEKEVELRVEQRLEKVVEEKDQEIASLKNELNEFKKKAGIKTIAKPKPKSA
jgi:hypothetical protein